MSGVILQFLYYQTSYKHVLNVYIELGIINTVHVYAEIFGSLIIGDPTLY